MLKWLKTLLSGRPHFVIGGKNPYLRRWYLLPRNRLCNVYLHQFLRDDDDRALHDHPWWSVSLVLRGQLREYRHDKPPRLLCPTDVVIRSPRFRHRLELVGGRPAWTLFFTGPKVRTWGFWCSGGKRFVPWYQFVAAADPGDIGPGCGAE